MLVEESVPIPITAPAGSTQQRRITHLQRRFLVGAVAVGVPPLLLCLDTGWFLLKGWRPAAGFDRRAAILVALAGPVWCALLALALAPLRRAVTRRWQVLVLASALGALTWLGLEAAIPTAPFHLRTPRTRELFRPDPRFLPGVVGDGRLTIDELGVRGDPLPPRASAYRILCVGGSTTDRRQLEIPSH